MTARVPESSELNNPDSMIRCPYISLPIIPGTGYEEKHSGNFLPPKITSSATGHSAQENGYVI